jgi:signal transduction histidine kinase
MGTHVVPWPDPGQEGDDTRDVPRTVAALLDRLNRFTLSLPSRFQAAGARLTDEVLCRAAVRPQGRAEVSPWHEGLDLDEAWAIGEGWRQSLLQAQSDFVPGPEEGHRIDWDEIHRALDRELLQISKSFQAQIDRVHRRALEDVSHDLRSPLNSILFLADALRTEHSGPLTDVQSRQVGVLYSATVTLVRLVNDLIDFARLGSRELITITATSFSIDSVLNDVHQLVSPLTDHREVSLVMSLRTEGTRSGDPHLLSRVLLNLVSNAVEAVDEGGKVSVEVLDAPSGDLRIEIGDDRVGTDIEHLRGLISDAEAGRRPGETRGWTRGLGLSICARLVKSAGGRMSINGRPETGAVFQVDLPFPPM